MALAIQDRYEGYGCKVQYTIGSDENPKGKKYLFTHIASDHTDEQLLKFAEAVEMLFDGFLLEFDVINDTKITVAPADKKPAAPATEEQFTWIKEIGRRDNNGYNLKVTL